jgi:hypothetical protein
MDKQIKKDLTVLIFVLSTYATLMYILYTYL